ncbi:tRNA dihydrouridine synthase DusB [Candidatus Kapabacteria bacterium]|nr:tRNA dihydrouridine synthase DusB [Candidatus Kapabacteria bacterium]
MAIDKKHTHIGNIPIGNGVFLAPMEDVCDLPFRVICKNLGADIVYTEFISSEGIIRDAKRAFQKMTIDPQERPVAVQIFGGNIDAMVQSAKIVEDAGADILDINFGCWVKKVVKRDAGAAFLKKPDEMAALTEAVAKAVNIPVTVKTRLGWDQDNIIITDVAKKIENAGAAALAVHCRTRDMGMTGLADWDWIDRIKEVIDIPLILNGDVVHPEDVKRAFDETSADAVMIGRGCIGYPFIFKRAKDYLETGKYPDEPDIYTRINTCIEHLELTVDFKGNHGIKEFRKHYSGYFKGYAGASECRKQLMECAAVDEVKNVLADYLEYLTKNDKLEAVNKTRTAPRLSCSRPDYVKRQTVGV